LNLLCQCKLCYLTWIDWTIGLEARKEGWRWVPRRSLTHRLYYYAYTPLLLLVLFQFQRQF